MFTGWDTMNFSVQRSEEFSRVVGSAGVWEWFVPQECTSAALCCSGRSVGVSLGGPRSTRITAPSSPLYQFLISCAELLCALGVPPEIICPHPA